MTTKAGEMSDYTQYSHEALCLLLDSRDAQVDRLKGELEEAKTANLAIKSERDQAVAQLHAKLSEAKKQLAYADAITESLERQLAEAKTANLAIRSERDQAVAHLHADLEVSKHEIDTLTNQLAEARVEVERLKLIISGKTFVDERKQAAMECMRICDDLEDEGYHYETCCHLTVRDRIKAKFGLEG